MLTRCSIVFGLFLISAIQPALGCTIPVFRYALDRWEADAFHLVLPASSAADNVQNELLRPLRANGKSNLNIETTQDATLTLPELRFSTGDQAPLWTGSVDGDSLGKILDSPMRKKLRERILAGDSVIWVVVDRGQPEDAPHLERIEKRIKFLEQVASLPIQDPNDPDSQLGPGPPLKLAFTVLRVRGADPAEALFLKMLAGPKSGIDPVKTSFAAAVFGRGRVLGAWALDVLDDASIEDASMFLVGRCSCRLKNENPGWDILMNVDWAKALENVGTVPPLNEEVVTTSVQPEAVKTTPLANPPSKIASTSAPAFSRPWLAVGGAVIMIALAFALIRSGGS
jgi:hypothetical protein